MKTTSHINQSLCLGRDGVWGGGRSFTLVSSVPSVTVHRVRASLFNHRCPTVPSPCWVVCIERGASEAKVVSVYWIILLLLLHLPAIRRENREAGRNVERELRKKFRKRFAVRDFLHLFWTCPGLRHFVSVHLYLNLYRYRYLYPISIVWGSHTGLRLRFILSRYCRCLFVVYKNTRLPFAILVVSFSFCILFIFSVLIYLFSGLNENARATEMRSQVAAYETVVPSTIYSKNILIFILTPLIKVLPTFRFKSKIFKTLLNNFTS